MNMFIKNAHDERIAVDVETPEKIRGIVFVAHGLGGFKEQPHILAFSRALSDKGFITVTWDARKTIGESDGQLLDATLSNYFDDFETVVTWASSQDWYTEPFIVCGHSLGAACAFLFTLKHSEKVQAIVLTSTFVSGLEFEKTISPETLTQWKQTRIREWVSSSKPGLLKRLSWNFMIDAYSYNILHEAKKITQPVLVIVGSDDTDTPVELQQRLFDSISSEHKELNIIEGAEHTFKNASHLSQVEQIIKTWVAKIL